MKGNQTRSYNQLSFVDVIINERCIQALVDTGASNNFIKKEVARDVGLRSLTCGASFKTVNSKVEAVVGTAKNVHLQLGKWMGCASFIVM